MPASPVPKIVLLALLSLAISGNTSVFAHVNTINQVKDKWITIEIPKYTDFKLEKLLEELRAEETKISTATFNYETRRLTVYYSDAITHDDVLQIVARFFSDFNKVGGTDL